MFLVLLGVAAVLEVPTAWIRRFIFSRDWGRSFRARWVHAGIGWLFVLSILVAAPVYYLATIAELRPPLVPQVVLSNGKKSSSLLPPLKEANTDWSEVAVTCLAKPESCSISADRYRYLHYANGDEERYETDTDPHEWNNVAKEPKHAELLAWFRDQAPKSFAPFLKPRVESFPALTLKKETTVPASRPDEGLFDVNFINERKQPVQLFWMDRQGVPKPYGTIPAGKLKRQRTRPGAVWLPQDTQGTKLGHFVIGDRSAKAVLTDSW